jgi:hypothetical protein
MDAGVDMVRATLYQRQRPWDVAARAQAKDCLLLFSRFYVVAGGAADEEVQLAEAAYALGGDAPQALLSAVRGMLSEGGIPKTYGVLKSAGVSVAGISDKDAAEWLGQAEPVLPKGEVREAGRFYRCYVPVLRNTRSYEAAVKAQERGIAITGKGYAQLAITYWFMKDEQRFRGVHERLTIAEAPEQDVLELARLFADLRKPNEALPLVESYLTKDRERSPECELETRLLAAGLYEIDTRLADALKALTVAHLADSLKTTSSQIHYKNALNLAGQIESRMRQEGNR